MLYLDKHTKYKKTNVFGNNIQMLYLDDPSMQQKYKKNMAIYGLWSYVKINF